MRKEKIGRQVKWGVFTLSSLLLGIGYAENAPLLTVVFFGAAVLGLIKGELWEFKDEN